MKNPGTDNNMNKKYPLVEYAFSLMDENASVNDAIEKLLEKIGELLHIDQIAVKEFNEEESSIKCTYEWSNDGIRELINVESRYVTENEISDWFVEYSKNEFGVWTYLASSGDCPIRIIRHNRVKSLLQIPLLKRNKFLGLVDFIDSKCERNWSADDIISLKQFCRILVSYMFNMRELEETTNKAKSINEYDTITHLPKYEIFRKEAAKSIQNIKDDYLVFLSIDFSNFKYINEKYGYIAGNRILEEFANDIYEYSNMVFSSCRCYSDNFMVILKYDEVLRNEVLIKRVEAVTALIQEKIHESYFDCNIIFNVGIYVVNDSKESVDTVISNANTARKFAKRLKKNNGYRCVFFNNGMAIKVKKQAEYVSSMTKALENNDFFVEYQPMVKTDSFEIIGAEALVRWKKDNRFTLYPEDFLSAFEQDGCVVKMDFYVYEQVFKYLSNKIKRKEKLIPVFINVSIVHFNSNNLIPYLNKMVEKYKVPSELIRIELSENIYISELLNVGDTINQLHAGGFKVYIDGFGTGFSSLNTLMKYKIDGIKLDRIFMKPDLDTKDEIVISCMINMANRLKLDVICEGIETEEQRSFLISNNCPYIQGNYFSKPVEGKQLDYLLDNTQ